MGIKMKVQYFIFSLTALLIIAAVLLLHLPQCGNGLLEGSYPALVYEECDDGNNLGGDGCSPSCLIEFPEKIYVAPYLGNIDGGFDEDWFYFYGTLTDFYDGEGIPVGATTYPSSINITDKFAPYIKRMYESKYIELVQKGNTGLGEELVMDTLSYERQREIIEEGREVYVKSMAAILGINESHVKLPEAYNQPQGRFTIISLLTLQDLGFKIFFEMYLNEELGPVKSSESVDVLQYGVGMTVEGNPGRNTVFYQPRDVLKRIREFDREDLYMLHINNSRVVPIWVHHMDFESREKDNKLDHEKWVIYTYVMRRLNQEPNITIIAPSEIWELRH